MPDPTRSRRKHFPELSTSLDQGIPHRRGPVRGAGRGARGSWLPAQGDEFSEVGIGKFGQGGLAGADDGVGERALGFQ